jgi:hypothetical protein
LLGSTAQCLATALARESVSLRLSGFLFFYFFIFIFIFIFIFFLLGSATWGTNVLDAEENAQTSMWRVN